MTHNFVDNFSVNQLRSPRPPKKRRRKIKNVVSSLLTVLNTRNPFQRLLSAWRDKFNVNHNPERQSYFLPSIKIFEGPYSIPEDFSSSFEAFIQFRAANPSDFTHNRHWRR